LRIEDQFRSWYVATNLILLPMVDALNSNVLVLNKLWQPIHTCSVRRAVKLLCLGHAQVVEAEGEMKYQTHDFGSWLEASTEKLTDGVIHSVRFAMKIPKVIVLEVLLLSRTWMEYVC